MSGNITRRGEKSWRIKYEIGRDHVTGKRRSQFETVHGTKKDAQTFLSKRLTEVAESKFVEPNKKTVAEFVRGRIDQWEASGKISAGTASRYRELNNHQIAPFIGDRMLQKLRRIDIEEWHTALRNGGHARSKGGIGPRTIGHAHRVLSKALTDAAKDNLVVGVVTKLEAPPKAPDEEVVIIKDVPAFIEQLKGSRLNVPAMVALFTGMRRGEVLALRWGRIDLDRKVIQVREAIEHTKAQGVRFKAPKSKAGRRDITLPDILADLLRDYRRTQLEFRFKLGAGKLHDDDLLFTDLDGAPLTPNTLSVAWINFTKRIGMPEITFHALRHSHASQLIDAGVDIVTISKRLGHAKPDITLRVYSHLFRKDDSKAAAAINAALKTTA
jgi:integrase